MSTRPAPTQRPKWRTAPPGALLALLLLCGPGLAQETLRQEAERPEAVRLELAAHPSGSLSPLAMTGFNYGNFMRVVGYQQDFARLSLRSLRFPPGNQADEVPLDTVAIDAFRAQWHLLGEPEIVAVANLFQGTPEDAAAAARHFARQGMPVKMWEIGNEPDLYASNRGDPSWTPDKYCRRFREFAAALKAHDPTTLLAGPGVSGARPGGDTYLREVLRRCGDAIDVLTWHVYPTDGSWTDEAALATTRQVGEEIARYRRLLEDPRANPLGYGRNTELGITEFGLSWRSSNYHHLEDMTAALWLAGALGQMARGGLERSHYFALQGTGGHGLIDNAGWLRPTYYVYEMLRDFSGAVIETRLDTPGLHAYAARGDSGLRILLVNLSTEPLTVALPAGPAGELTVATLSEPIFDEILGYQLETQNAATPVAVPARAVVVVTRP